MTAQSKPRERAARFDACGSKKHIDPSGVASQNLGSRDWRASRELIRQRILADRCGFCEVVIPQNLIAC